MGRPGPKPREIKERFLQKVSPEPNTGCWLWIGAVNRLGYGEFYDGRRGRKGHSLAHRLAYELFCGPIPPGKQLDHLCRIPCCVNPQHLEPVTPKENVSRNPMQNKNRRKSHCLRGHPLTGKNLYVYHPSGRRKCRKCEADRAVRKQQDLKIQGEI